MCLRQQMQVNTMFNLKGQKDALTEVFSMGKAALAAEYMMVLDRFPELRFHTKGFALPLPSAEDKIDVPLAGGLVTHAAPMAKTDFSHSITIIETVAGHALNLLEGIAYERTIAESSFFDFTIYQGTPDLYARKWRCTHGMLHGFDAPEIDGENRTQIMQYTGQIAYHCFGSEKGNI